MPGTSDGRGTLRFMRRGKVGDALERVADYVWCNDSNPTMVHTTPNDKKDADSIESQNKPAAITVNHPGRGAVTYDATHFIINSEVVSIYLGARSDGIDIQAHITRCVIDRTGNDDDPGAGTGAGTVVETGDVVTVGDESRSSDPGPWKVKEIENGEARLWSSMQPIRHEPVSDLTVVTKAEDTTLPHSIPEHDDDDNPELVTDGGHSITPGDVVTHADERWRVGRIGRAHVEIYQLGEGSTVVDIDEVAVNEVVA